MSRIDVSTQQDWLTIATLNGPVVDPLILRCGELFLRGAANAAQARDLLSQNLWALSTFFDRIVLDDSIPVFDYPSSFDMGQNFDERTLAQVNADDEILVDVHIGHVLYEATKTAALAELQKVFAGGPAVVASDAVNIVGELSSSGYAWYPQLDGLAVGNEHEARLASYILGGLIFGSYAQQSGADHLMQPKRSRLFLSLSLGKKAERTLEEQLFKRLGDLAGHAAQDVSYTPTFFPLLLSQSTGPRTLLRNALDLRKSSEASDYRQWLRSALSDFDVHGRIGLEREREVKAIADSIERKIAREWIPRVDMKMTIADAAAISSLKNPSLGIDLNGTARTAWGWMISRLPNKRHRKLLTRAVIAEHEYPRLERLAETVWAGPGFE